jgi:hypothetical protein
MSKIRLFGFLGAAALLAVPALSEAATLVLRRNAVVPIVFNDLLTIKDNRAGDRFTARVDASSGEVPRGTKFEGRVVSVRQARDGQPSSMDLEFTEIILPDGTRRPMKAIPIPLNDATISRDRDGRMVAKRDNQKTGKYALGGALGGLVLGSLGKKPLEGAILGALAGAAVGEEERKRESTTVVQKGQKFGVLVERDIRIDYRDDRGDRYDEDRDWDDRDRDDRDYDDRDRDRDQDDRNWDRDEIVIEHDEREMRFDRDEEPYRVGQTVMVPLKSVADQLGLEVDEGRYSALYVSGENGSLRLQKDSREARLNGKAFTLDQAVVERDGVLYVPVDAFAKISRESVRVNGNRIDRGTY